MPGTAFRALSAFPGKGLLGFVFVDERASGATRQAASFFVAADQAARHPWLEPARSALALARGRSPFHVFQRVPSSPRAIDVRYEDARVDCEIHMHGRHVLTLSMPRRGEKTLEATPL
ncbi:MAG: hypothetical protein H5U40_00365, partial [Polyangiaceae bacterium]|nr:hypothetical protein [Polyangiaceae bacterium]